MAGLGAAPDVCGALEAWRRARFARAAAPLGLDRFDGGRDLEPISRVEPSNLTRAAERMRELGVGAGAARRFKGVAMFRGIDVDFD
jgi:hypothetical protein